MPATGHVHRLGVIAWNTRPENPDEYRELYGHNALLPAVLVGCQAGVCAKVDVIRPKRLDRKVPAGITEEQFQALKSGQYWPEIATPT